jgi:hypothetical protein
MGFNMKTEEFSKIMRDSGVPVGSKNEFDLKHYIDDLKCFETMFFCFCFVFK